MAVLLCAALALFLRLMASNALPLDYDEPVYLSTAQDYARGVRAGDLSVLRTDPAPENPQLMKLLFGAALLSVADAPTMPVLPNIEAPAAVLRAARLASGVSGALHAAALALVNPLAGALLGLHSGHVKYTSLVMLEALPGLTALLCVLAYRRSRGRWGGWLALSGAMLGLTAAGKYLYCIAAVAIVLDALLSAARSPRSMRAFASRLAPLAPWGLIACAVFVAVSPHLWSNPIQRVTNTLAFHASLSAVGINTTKYVWWQALAWIGASAPWSDRALPVRMDGAIAVLAAVGLPALWRRQRVFALWLTLGIAFLLIYPNRMPQYALTVLTPLCLAAAAGSRWLLLAALPGLFRRASPLRLLRLVAAPLALGAASLAGVLALNNNTYNADPSFLEATQWVQEHMAPDETAIALLADPAVRGAVLEPGWRSWNPLPDETLAARNGMLAFDNAAAALNRLAAGRHGVWLITHQRVFGDPSDGVQTLLQRQTAINGPAFSREFARDYALVHYRFDAGYEPVPEQPALNAATVDVRAGQDKSLRAEGCTQLRPARVGEAGGVLEVTCFWRSQPYLKLPWDTRLALTLMNSQGQALLRAEPLIARSGFPWFRFEQTFSGVYLLTLPPGFQAGDYDLHAQPVAAGERIAPALNVKIAVGE